ncbi:M23 family metallopeptidase [Kaistella yonginensis]|uniref:M23 family metallopeptidase n=1 Tax=Kaistella yonginensis TaxID=658267 RepID=UPI0025B3CE4D|nr:M23 family metallopeptidase [Kaistella yonginensis]MDN3605285.1 M23 family metallopeptidase [Kaistella yonginensis]
MMNIKKKFVLILTVVFSYSIAKGQFNTLTRNIGQKETISVLPSENKITRRDFKNEKNKNTSFKKLFNITTKGDLKKEIDSLKTVVFESKNSQNKEDKFNLKKIEDSLIQLLKSKIEFESKSTTSKNIKTFEFLDDNPSNTISKISMPLKNRIWVTSPFGNRTHPIFGGQKFHKGADLKANYEKVYAVLDGKIIDAGYDSKGGGNYIKIKHSNSFVTSYLHLSEIYYKVGEWVHAGFIIAKSGNSGNSTGPHLHFSVSENGNYINPIRFLNDLIKANNLIATHYAN